MSVEVRASGPLFDGRAPGIIQDFLEDAQMAVGAQGLADVHRLLDASIRHPTPYYETQLTVQRLASDVVVHDRGIVYGPWLENGGSRSAIFAGYHSFRRARQELERKVPALVEPALRRHVARLG
jgi:hypothetical protein